MQELSTSFQERVSVPKVMEDFVTDAEESGN